FTGRRNAFEYPLPPLGVHHTNRSPGHPQTQAKIERFDQTLQRWLTARAPARTLSELQHHLDAFQQHDNEQRPAGPTAHHPALATRAPPNPLPPNGRAPGHYRLRYDRLDNKGKMSIRRAGRMHHLAIGTAHARKRVLALADEHHITLIELDTGELL